MRCKKCDRETTQSGFATYRNKNKELKRRGVCKECRGQYAIDNFEKPKEYRKKYNGQNRSKKRQRDRDLRRDNRVIIDRPSVGKRV